MKRRKELVEQLLQNMRIVRRMLGGLGAKEKQSSITGAQWAVLSLLVREEQLTIKEVSKELGVSSSAATQLVDSLVASGHVSRIESTKDRREVCLTLTKRTGEKLQRMLKEHTDKLLKLFDALSDEEFQQYVALTSKIASSLTQRK